MENFWKLLDHLIGFNRRHGNTSQYEVVFRAECGDFTILDIEVDDDAQKTYVLLLEAGK